MTLGKVLVFADASEDGLARLAIAAKIAETEGAALEAQVIALAPQPPYGVGAAAMADVYGDARAGAHSAGAVVAARVRGAGEKLTKTLMVEQQDVVQSDLRARAAALAQAADLVVLGQPESQDRSDIDSEVLVGALLGGGRPILMLPRWPSAHPWGKRAVIAWKGAPQAARAVHAATPFLKRADVARMVVVDGRGDYFGEGPASVGRMAAHLARQGVKLEQPTFRTSVMGEAGPEILSEVESMGADLLVMGGYGRARLAEIVFGGVTRDIIRKARVPVLLSH